MSKAEEIDFNDNLRQNYTKACKLLGVKEDAAVVKAINPEPDAAAPVVVIATDSALGPAGGLCSRVDPITGHVFERLWRYVFVAPQDWADPQQEESGHVEAGRHSLIED